MVAEADVSKADSGKDEADTWRHEPLNFEDMNFWSGVFGGRIEAHGEALGTANVVRHLVLFAIQAFPIVVERLDGLAIVVLKCEAGTSILGVVHHLDEG